MARDRADEFHVLSAGLEILAGDDFRSAPTFYLDNLIRPTNELDPTDLKSGRVKVGSAPTVPMGISAYERCWIISSVNVRTRACLDVIYTYIRGCQSLFRVPTYTLLRY